MEGILGRKLGITQIFTDDGATVPVTVVEAGPCVVVARRTQEKDGYEAVQIGLVEARPPRKVTKPMQGHFKKAGVTPTREIAEFAIAEGEAFSPGDQIKVSIFSEKDFVDVTGVSKGKGFQGVMKRHGFRGGRSSHGSMFHRAPGSIGGSSNPSRVFPGMRAAGRMGGERVTVKNLLVVKIDEEKNLIYLRGAVPGAPNAYVAIRRAKRG
jgi:large subunit ribosomal protein L3